MTTSAVPNDGDPRLLLAGARTLARRVRLAQRVTWLPLLVLALVTFGAIPVYMYGHVSVIECQPESGGRACKVWLQAVDFYWSGALLLAYAVIAGGYLRVARARGLGARMLPYVLTGAALVLLYGAVAPVWLLTGAPDLPDTPLVRVLFRLLDPPGAVGVALLVLAWLERRAALLLFTVGYLVVVLVPVTFGWGEGWGSRWQFAPPLVISGGLLLLGSAGFALAQRLRRPR